MWTCTYKEFNCWPTPIPAELEIARIWRIGSDIFKTVEIPKPKAWSRAVGNNIKEMLHKVFSLPWCKLLIRLQICITWANFCTTPTCQDAHLAMVILTNSPLLLQNLVIINCCQNVILWHGRNFHRQPIQPGFHNFVLCTRMTFPINTISHSTPCC